MTMKKGMTIKERETALIRALRSTNGWATRKSLADALNKTRLLSEDLMLLEVLASSGRIERRVVPSDMKNIERIEYRLKA